jgi:hypothetical protein
VTKDEFIEWKEHPATQEIKSKIRDRIEQLQYELGNTAGENSVWDAKRSGIIVGMTTLLDIGWEE